jgi:carboxymethylenebutenolidase
LPEPAICDAAGVATVTIDVPSGPLSAYVSRPDRPGPWPGVVVVHDALGMSQDLRNQADWLSGEGYLAAAPDLFRGRNQTMCIVSVFRQASAGHGPVFDDIDATRAWLTAQGECTGAVGVIGYCMGGGLALLVAPKGRFGASSVNYGSARKQAYSADLLRGACPVVGSFGGKDKILPGRAARLESALTSLGVDHDVKEYPSAGHAFLNDHEAAGDRLPILFRVMVKLTPGIGYDEASARDARARIVAFFDAHLKH